MRPNRTRQRLAAGLPALGLFVSSASPLTAEIVGNLGVDWLLVDLQHGENNLGNLSPMLQAASATAATPFVRVAANDAVLIQRSLDLGAYGLVVPLVNTPAEATTAVRNAKYPPLGERSWGPIRGSLYGADYFEQANDETELYVMLETRPAIEAAAEILAVPGVAGCLIGPNDLGISYGEAPEAAAAGRAMSATLEGALEQVLAACAATGRVPGIVTYTADDARRRIAQGFRLISLGTELRLLRAAAVERLATVRQGSE